MSCFVFTFSLFYVTLVYRCNSFAVPMYNGFRVLFWGQLQPALYMRVSSSFIEDQWLHGLVLIFSSRWGCCLFDTYTIPIRMQVVPAPNLSGPKSFRPKSFRPKVVPAPIFLLYIYVSFGNRTMLNDHDHQY